jgi:hypothetical protein
MLSLESDSLIHDVELLDVPKEYKVVNEALPPAVSRPSEAADESRTPPPPPKPGVTCFEFHDQQLGSPSAKYGANVVLLRDDEGKYLSPTVHEGANIRLEALAGPKFSVRILAKNNFPLTRRQETVDRFFLFTLKYKNGTSELFRINLKQDTDFVWQSRYSISRSGPEIMNWTATTDFRPWNDAMNFNEYKVVHNGSHISFFVNGEFVRTETSRGDTLAAVEMPVRFEERLYDIIVQDMSGSTSEDQARDSASPPNDAQTTKTGETSQKAPTLPNTAAKPGGAQGGEVTP